MAVDKEFLYEAYIVQDRSEREIAKELNVTVATIDYYVRKYNLNIKRSNPDLVFNLKHIDKTDPIFCYFAGLLATDGYFDYKNKRISIRVNNIGSKEVFESLRNYFEYIRPVRCYDREDVKRPLYDLTIPNSCIFEELKKMGIYGKKDSRSFSTEWFMGASKECQQMFLRGILDGDGCINDKSFRIAMKSVDFVANIAEVVNTMLNVNYSVKVQTNQTKTEYPLFYMRKEDSRKLLDFIYEGFDSFRFLDKYNKYMSIR